MLGVFGPELIGENGPLLLDGYTRHFKKKKRDKIDGKNILPMLSLILLFNTETTPIIVITKNRILK